LKVIILNITYHPTWQIHDEWIQWLKSAIIEKAESVQGFHKYQLLKLTGVDESAGPTYAVQFYADDMRFVQNLRAVVGATFARQGMWTHDLVCFDTTMEVIN
jgi:hypothetical protein